MSTIWHRIKVLRKVPVHNGPLMATGWQLLLGGGLSVVG